MKKLFLNPAKANSNISCLVIEHVTYNPNNVIIEDGKIKTKN